MVLKMFVHLGPSRQMMAPTGRGAVMGVPTHPNAPPRMAPPMGMMPPGMAMNMGRGGAPPPMGMRQGGPPPMMQRPPGPPGPRY